MAGGGSVGRGGGEGPGAEGNLFSRLLDHPPVDGDSAPGAGGVRTAAPSGGAGSPDGSGADAGDGGDGVVRPLAVRMRPVTLDDVVGQSRALGAGSPLRRLAAPVGSSSLTAPSSIILFGPPGVGKTTLATIVARSSGRAFEELSAVTGGVRDVRAVLARAHERLVREGRETVLFIDEVHRFSKSQQDALLPGVENRDVTFIGATTENPSFSVISPLLSRSVVVRLEPLTHDDLSTLIDRAVSSERGLRGAVKVDGDARDELIRLSGGDGRRLLGSLEAAAAATTSMNDASDKPVPVPAITAETVANVMDVNVVRYDHDGDEHYDVASAFIKSMRGSDPDATVHYLARMLRAGEDPRFVARRIMIAAAEEVGLAAPQVLQLAVSAAQAVDMVGMPEARIILSEAALAVATAPKSNASYLAVDRAIADVDAGDIGAVPVWLRNPTTSMNADMGYGKGYKYAHDEPGAVAAQQYLPDPLVGREYYEPTARGHERELGPRVARIRAILRGELTAAEAQRAAEAGAAATVGTATARPVDATGDDGGPARGDGGTSTDVDKSDGAGPRGATGRHDGDGHDAKLWVAGRRMPKPKARGY